MSHHPSAQAETRLRQALGARLVGLRKGRHLTQKEMADRIALPQHNLSRYERGVNAPSLGTLVRLSRFFSVTLDYLITGTSPPARTGDR